MRDQYPHDPAFTEDVRHLALPLRRNSGPESEAIKMFGKKKAKANSKEEHSSHYSLRLERRKKTQANNYSAEYLCKNSSSSESLDNIISSYKGRKGFSLDRNTQSFDVEQKPQTKPKRSSWFLRDRSRDKQSKKEKFLKRSSLDFTLTYDAKPPEKTRSKAKTIQRQNAADYTGDSSTTPQEEIPEPKKSGLSKFQIGKRFLKGEIGIRSFNYYLLKEGLKKNSGKQKSETVAATPSGKSKSEENIYEEIYFRHDQPTPKPKTPPALPPFNKQSSVPLIKTVALSNDGNCINCEICLQEAVQENGSIFSAQNCDKCVEHRQQNLLITGSLSGSEGYAQVVSNRKINDKSIYDFFQKQQQGQTVLQFQSYNPNNPNVYKIETTPVAFDYTPIEEQIYQMELNQLYHQAQRNFSGDGKIVPKSSSSSDSIKGQNQRHRQQQLQQQSNEFYTRPNYFYPSNDDKQTRKDQNNSIYKTDSSNSIRSESSLNKIYNSKNSSQKSNHSNKSAGSNHIHNRDETHIRQDMSDSSLGDSLFSSDANKRYFGSSESCRFNYECGRRRCSLENEKCSFSDTCRYECNLRNCDCSSSYFSSDFDDYNTTNNSRIMKSHHNNNQQSCEYQQQQIYDQKTNRYAEDFIKHVSNVKRRSQFEANSSMISPQQMLTTSIYEVPKKNPKRLDTDALRNESDNKAIGDELGIKDTDKTLTHDEYNKANHRKATGTVPKLSSSISSNESKKKSALKHERENKQREMIRNEANESESLPKALHDGEKSSAVGKMVSSGAVSATLEMKTTEKPNGDNTKTLDKDLQSKSEQQKKLAADDDDDEVFLESHDKSVDRKTVSAIISHFETNVVTSYLLRWVLLDGKGGELLSA